VPDADVIEIGSGAEETCIGHAKIEAMNALVLADAAEDHASGSIDFQGMDLDWHTISREGPVAWVTAEGAIRAVVGGREIRDPFRWTMIFVLREGTWLIINSHFSVPDPRVAEGRGWPTYIDAVASEVRREEPDLAAQTGLDGTVTLLFSDIEESTPIAEQLGDLRWMQVLREHNALVRECVARQSGFEVKTIGDAFMIAFQSARRALLCAIDIQRAFAAYSDEHPEQAVRVRIGMHVGEPVREADDFYGKSVILASRIAGQARGGEILVSSLLRELIESAGDIRFDEGRETTLKGLTGTHRLYAVLQA
jgi:class 3 adenylate cyclase